MSLIENTLFGIRDKVQVSIDRLKEFEPPEGYYVAFSGGKDSIVIKDLVIRSGCKAEFVYNLVTCDPPELIYYMRRYHSDVIVSRSKDTMWSLFAKKGTPTRMIRWCCAELKERGGHGRLVVTGVRWAESVRRSKRQMVELCYNDTSKRYLHPIIDWSEDEVWQYIHENNLPYCSLYDEGFKRIGCVMCPQQGPEGMKRDAKRWPQFAKNYLSACQRAFDYKKSKGLKMPSAWKSGQDMYEWWVSGKPTEETDPDQQRFFFE